jgi:hypothetical protein
MSGGIRREVNQKGEGARFPSGKLREVLDMQTD